MKIADAFEETTIAGLDLGRYIEVGPDTAVSATVNAMREAELSCACVVDNGQILGMFTQGDILQRVIGRDRDWGGPISNEMTTGLKTAGPNDTLKDALDIMIKWWVRNLPVVAEDGRFIGNLSFSVVVETMTALLAQRFESEAPEDDLVRESLEFIDFTGINLRPPVTVSADDPVEIGITYLRNRGLELVMVADERGHLIGTLTAFALQQRLGCDVVDLTTLSTREVMVDHPHTISVRAPIQDAIKMLQADHLSNVALVGETGRPAGVASFRQIADYVESALEAQA